MLLCKWIGTRTFPVFPAPPSARSNVFAAAFSSGPWKNGPIGFSEDGAAVAAAAGSDSAGAGAGAGTVAAGVVQPSVSISTNASGSLPRSGAIFNTSAFKSLQWP